MHAEIQRSFNEIRGSYLDDSNNGPDALNQMLGGGDRNSNQYMNMLNRKVDQIDFNKIMSTKTNIKETSMM